MTTNEKLAALSAVKFFEKPLHDGDDVTYLQFHIDMENDTRPDPDTGEREEPMFKYVRALVEYAKVHQSEPKPSCECCEGTGKVEILPDTYVYAPCTDCRPEEDLKLWKEGYKAAEEMAKQSAAGAGEVREAIKRVQYIIKREQMMLDMQGVTKHHESLVDISAFKTLIRAAEQRVAGQAGAVEVIELAKSAHTLSRSALVSLSEKARKVQDAEQIK